MPDYPDWTIPATVIGSVTIVGVVSISGTVTVTGTVSISGTVTVTGTVAISGTVTVTGAVTVSGTVGISGTVTVTGTVAVSGTVTVTGAVTVSGTVAISGTVTVAGTVSISGTVTISGTVSITGTVTISGSVTITSGAVTISTSGGTNIIIDKLLQGAYASRQWVMTNDSDPSPGSNPPGWVTGSAWRGKFIPRGMRGMIRGIHIYCKRTGSGTLTLSYAPHPGMGAVGSIVVTPGADWAWKYNDILSMWNYDSLFVWVSACSADVSYGHDSTSPYDLYYSGDSGVHWYTQDYRLHIRVYMEGSTPGDLPVSGTLNTVALPAVSSYSPSGSVAVPGNSTATILTVGGAGCCPYIEFQVQAATHSDEIAFEVQCDGATAAIFGPESHNNLGYGPTVPSHGIVLVKYAVDGVCVMVTNIPFSFRRELKLRAQDSSGTAQTVYAKAHVNLIG